MTETRVSIEDERQARDILRHVWCNQHCIVPWQVGWLESRALPDETALDTCSRLARVDLRGIKAYDHAAVRARVALAEVHSSLPILPSPKKSP